MKTAALHVCACLAVVAFSGGARAAPPDSSALDDRLFGDSRDNPPGAAVLESSPSDAPAAPGNVNGTPGNQGERSQLGEAAIAEDAHPLLAIASQMRDVQARLPSRAGDSQTVAMQKQIVSQLAQLLEQARRHVSSAGETSRQAPPASDQQPGTSPAERPGRDDRSAQQSPARQSTEDPGPDATAAGPAREQDAWSAMERLWNQLPARRREQLLQLAPERFLPEYEPQIEEYFRRLSEEQP